jgi:hypothetical protein
MADSTRARAGGTLPAMTHAMNAGDKRMIRIPGLVSRAAAALALGALLVLAGCSSGNLKDSQVAKAEAAGQFDTTVEAYKSGQFLLDGAVVSAADLGAHFAYLKDQDKLPKTVLLTRSDESKVRSTHLEFMARMAIDNGFTVYYDHKGELRKINAIEKNARALEDSHPKPKIDSDPMRGRGAADGGYSPVNDGRQY